MQCLGDRQFTGTDNISATRCVQRADSVEKDGATAQAP